MTFDDYLRDHQFRFAELAGVVARIIGAALDALPGLPRPQQVQQRAKQEQSLRRKLERDGLLAATDVEGRVKDLAGCRLIYYTNADVDRFLQSAIIADNFDIDRDASRIHHPVGEAVPAARLYSANHYVVALKPDRLALPEYARFAGMRCEVQVQTTLIHAWAETGHDIIYKRPLSPGFGARQMAAIEQRFERVMRDYLVPAGYELQKIQHDFERLMEGKALFDRGAVEALATAVDNNQRWDTLKRIADHVLPHYDDHAAIYPELRRAIVQCVLDARTTPTRAVETAFGAFPGRAAADVTDAGLEIIERLRYLDPSATFDAYCEIYRGAATELERKRIVEAVQRLSQHDRAVWQQRGPLFQEVLVARVATFDASQRAALFDLAVTVCCAAVGTEVSGTTSSADTVTFHRGAVVHSASLERTRASAIAVLQTLMTDADTEPRRRFAFRSLKSAMELPNTGRRDDRDLERVILANAGTIVDWLTCRVRELSFELLQHIEHALLWLHHRTSEHQHDDPASAAVRTTVLDAIARFREAANADPEFVIYKTLVGFESVFPFQWEKDRFDHADVQAHREQELTRYVGLVDATNEALWLARLRRCAATRSDDLATFPTFAAFLRRLATEKSDIVLGWLGHDDNGLFNFLPALLEGLDGSPHQAEARAVMNAWIGQGRHLHAITRRLRFSAVPDLEALRAAAQQAFALDDYNSLIEIVAAIIVRPQLGVSNMIDELLMPAVERLTANADCRWVEEVWHEATARIFLAALSERQAGVILTNLVLAREISYHVETVLNPLAEAHHDLVWQFFADRIAHKGVTDDERYEDVPYELHTLPALAAQPARAVAIVRSWFSPDDPLFRFRGGRLIAIAFPAIGPELEAEVLGIMEREGATVVEFVTAILANYNGEPATYPIVKALIDALPNDDERLQDLDSVLWSTGVLEGQFGFVEAYQTRRAAIAEWLTDPRPRVAAFARQFVARLDNAIAAEQRQAEQRGALRRLDHERPAA